jgi:hypothetical protein
MSRRVIDEEWRWVDYEGIPGHGCLIHGQTNDVESCFMPAARGKLASAAPDMARLLERLEWTQYVDCPDCSDGDRDHPGCHICLMPEHIGHAPDCEWLRVMRKAGLQT